MFIAHLILQKLVHDYLPILYADEDSGVIQFTLILVLAIEQIRHSKIYLANYPLFLYYLFKE